LIVLLLFLSSYHHPRTLPSFPTRRSSDLHAGRNFSHASITGTIEQPFVEQLEFFLGLLLFGDIEQHTAQSLGRSRFHREGADLADRKSTRLKSSHEWISYAVFCLKKKKKR